MKRSNLSKIVGASILSLSLAALPNLSASAQSSTTSPETNSTTTDSTTTTTNSDRAVNGQRDDMDWDWLGLLGLLGLAGLAGRKREEPTRYREPDEVSRTGSSTRY